MSFLKALRDWSKRQGTTDRAALKAMLEAGESPAEIGRRFNCDGRSVRLWMDQWRIERGYRPKIFRTAQESGVGTLSAYFRLRWGSSLRNMAAELGVSVSTVAAYYAVFSLERMEANHGK